MTERRRSEKALSEVIGLIVLLGLITVVMAVYVVYSVPADGRENEIRLMNGVKDSFTGYKTSLDSLWINAPANPAGLTGTYGITAENDIVLGTAGTSKDFISLFPLLKPTGSFGSIRINENDGTVRIIKDGDEELLNISIGSMRYQSSNNYWVQQEFIYQMGGVFLSQQGGVINKISPTFSVYNKSNKAAVSITPINVTGSNYLTGGGRVTSDTNLLPSLQYYTSTLGAETIRIEIDPSSLQEAQAWEKVFKDSAYMNNLPSGWYSTGSSGDASSGNAYIEITGPSTGEDVDVVIDIFRADFLTTIRGALPGVGSTPATTGTPTPTPTPSPPVADFSGSPTSGERPLTVTFTDLSTNSPTSWAWTFGEGNTSTAQNPSHTYSSAGTYTVSLTATNSGGSDTETKTNYITVIDPVPSVIFFEDFENGNLNGWTYYRAWTTSSPAIGSYSADFWRNGYISQTIPTTGYTGINVSFYLGASTSLDSGESVAAYWAPDGSSWTLLKQINDGDPEEDGQLHFFSYVLPTTADNNANFALRFRTSASRNNEHGYVDNVRVEGYD